MPILYDEYGVESAIPADEARALHAASSRRRPSRSTRRRRRAYYRSALQLAFCQPNVAGMLLFHTHDETRARRLAVGRLLRRRLAEDVARARAARDGPRARTHSGRARSRRRCLPRSRTAERTISLRCERACTYRARLLRLPRRTAVATRPAVPPRAAPPGVGRPGREHARLVPALVSFVDAALPGRPVERVSTPYVVRVSSPPRSLPGAVATTLVAPRFWSEP